MEEAFFCNTLSPILFLLSFTPIIKFASPLPSSEYRLSLKFLYVKGLHPISAHLHVEWEDVDSSEPVGWYLKLSEVFYHSDMRESFKLWW